MTYPTSDGRYIEVSDYPYLPQRVKQPGDDLTYAVDYKKWSTGMASPAITARAATFNPALNSPTVGTLVNSADNLAILVPVTGGTAGYKGVLTVKATFNDSPSSDKEQEIYYEVKETS